MKEITREEEVVKLKKKLFTRQSKKDICQEILCWRVDDDAGEGEDVGSINTYLLEAIREDRM